MPKVWCDNADTSYSGGYIISAIFICAEYQRLGIHWREYGVLRYSFWMKLGFIFVELALAIAFAVLEYRGTYNTSAILEWTISLIYIFYVWSKSFLNSLRSDVPSNCMLTCVLSTGFIIDFLPAIHTRHKEDRFPPIRREDDEMAMRTQEGGNMMGGPVYSNGGRNGGGYGDTDSYNSQHPMQHQQPASRNF